VTVSGAGVSDPAILTSFFAQYCPPDQIEELDLNAAKIMSNLKSLLWMTMSD